MKSGIHGDYFILKVKNSCNEDCKLESGKIFKSNKSEPNHGYGIKIIDNIAKKYNGSFQMEYQDKVMSTVVVLCTNQIYSDIISDKK